MYFKFVKISIFSWSVLKSFTNFTGKQLRWSLFLITLQAWRSTCFQHWCFPVKLAKFLRPPILKNICEQLLLNITKFSDQVTVSISGYMYFYYFHSTIPFFYRIWWNSSEKHQSSTLLFLFSIQRICVFISNRRLTLCWHCQDWCCKVMWMF